MALAKEVVEMLDDNNKNVRKWGTQLLALADYSQKWPDTLWDATTNRPNALPDYFKIMGYISTDGAKMSRNIESSDVSACQDLEPVRSDITGRTRTLQLTFLEMNAWVKALQHGLPVSQWPTDKNAGFEFTDGEATDFPYYRLLWLGQDGVGADAHYRIEGGYRVKVSNQGDSTKNRSDPENEDVTFTFYRDPVLKKSFYEGEKIAKSSASQSSASVGKQVADSTAQPVGK